MHLLLAPAPRALVVPLTLVLALTIASCGLAPFEDSPRRKNLLLITIDTLRADHVGSYGYRRPTTPAIDALAREAVLFLDAQASSSWTLPTVASIMTSLYTSSHGCWGNDTPLDPTVTTLAESLAGVGFATGAVTTHAFVARRYGMDQGFASFEDAIIDSGSKNPHMQVSSPWVNAKAIAWLDEQRAVSEDTPWFLWVHYFDPHYAYRPHEGITEQFGRLEKIDRYDGEIAFTDQHVGALLDHVASLGADDETIVVLVADHGEEFGEHGRDGHRQTLYGEVVQVPLLIRVPGMSPRRVPDRVRTIDVLPTMLELLDVPLPAIVQGRSLVPLLRGESLPPRAALTELRDIGAKFDSIAEGRFKLIVNRANAERQLYDLTADPLEQSDVAADHPERVAQLEASLASEIARAKALGARLHQSAGLDLAPAEIEHLRALGYVGSNGGVGED